MIRMCKAKITHPNYVPAEVNSAPSNGNNDISYNIRAASSGVEQLDKWETDMKENK